MFEGLVDAPALVPSPRAVALAEDVDRLGRLIEEVSHAPDDEVVGLFFLVCGVRVPTAVLGLLAVAVDEQRGRLVARTAPRR